MEHINWIRKFAFSLWDSNQITDDDYNKVRFHLVELEKLVLPQADVIKSVCVECNDEGGTHGLMDGRSVVRDANNKQTVL